MHPIVNGIYYVNHEERSDVVIQSPRMKKTAYRENEGLDGHGATPLAMTRVSLRRHIDFVFGFLVRGRCAGGRIASDGLDTCRAVRVGCCDCHGAVRAGGAGLAFDFRAAAR